MNPNATLLKTLPRKRRTALGLVFASVVLGSSLTACGSGAGDTTCGEFIDMSAGDRRDVLEDLADDDGSDEADEFKDLGEEEKDQFASLLATACEGEDEDTSLDDFADDNS